MLLFPKASLRSLHFCTSPLCNLKKSFSFSPSRSNVSSLHPLALAIPARGTYQLLPRARSRWLVLPPLVIAGGRTMGRGQGRLKGTLQGAWGSRQPGATELPWCQNTPYSSAVSPADGRCYRNRNYRHKNFSSHEKAKATVSYSHPPYDFIHYNRI